MKPFVYKSSSRTKKKDFEKKSLFFLNQFRKRKKGAKIKFEKMSRESRDVT